MSESEVLGRLFSLAVKLLGVINQIKVLFESLEAGAAGGKVMWCVFTGLLLQMCSGFVFIHAHLWHRRIPALTLPCGQFAHVGDDNSSEGSES